MDNYRRSLEYDLRDLRSKMQILLPTYRKAEEKYSDSEQAVYAKQRELQEAEIARDSFKEKFRALHQPYCHLKQEMGEIQEELFKCAEDESEWTH